MLQSIRQRERERMMKKKKKKKRLKTSRNGHIINSIDLSPSLSTIFVSFYFHFLISPSLSLRRAMTIASTDLILKYVLIHLSNESGYKTKTLAAWLNDSDWIMHKLFCNYHGTMCIARIMHTTVPHCIHLPNDRTNNDETASTTALPISQKCETHTQAYRVVSEIIHNSIKIGHFAWWCHFFRV